MTRSLSWHEMLLVKISLLRESENLSTFSKGCAVSLKAILASQGLYQSSHPISVRQVLIAHLIKTDTTNSLAVSKINSTSSKRITRRFQALKKSGLLERS